MWDLNHNSVKITMSLEIYIPNIVVNMVLTQGNPGLESWGADEDEEDHASGEVLKITDSGTQTERSEILQKTDGSRNKLNLFQHGSVASPLSLTCNTWLAPLLER